MHSPHELAAERRLRQICTRHRVSYQRGARLLPLVQRALSADGELRRALLDVVEASLARDACDGERAASDARALAAVASALHSWGHPE